MKKMMMLLAVFSVPVMATPNNNEAGALANKSVINALISMQIEANCLEQIDAKKTFIANKPECLKALNKLSDVLIQEKGFDDQVKRIANYKTNYEL